MKNPKYQIEIWTREGKAVADITEYCENIRFVEERNEAEELRFNLDLDAFEEYMLMTGSDPVSNFREGQTELKVRRNKEYLFGTQLHDAPINLNAEGSATIEVFATGYLNFLNARYPDPAIKYTNVESVEIFYDLIRQAQTATFGNYGLKIPASGYYVTGVKRDRSFDLYTSSTKLNMQRLTALDTGNFDFRILADKTVMTYPITETVRSDFELLVDRGHFTSKVVRARLNRSANGLYNQIIGIGSGQSFDSITSIQNDIDSQNEFGLRQHPVQFNEVKNVPTLDANTIAYLERRKRLLRLPNITLTGVNLPAVPIELGDLIKVRFAGRRLLEDMTGIHRVERIETSIDENGYIKEQQIYFDKTEILV